ncbi:MAG: hypothetical protein ACOYUZ_04510 [Patescibacteria group bacterium]
MENPGKQLEILQEALVKKGPAGKTAAQSFFEACLAFSRAKALRLPNMLMNEPQPDIKGAANGVISQAKEIKKKYPEIQNDFLNQAADEPDPVVIRALIELMRRNL